MTKGKKDKVLNPSSDASCHLRSAGRSSKRLAETRLASVSTLALLDVYRCPEYGTEPVLRSFKQWSTGWWTNRDKFLDEVFFIGSLERAFSLCWCSARGRFGMSIANFSFRLQSVTQFMTTYTICYPTIRDQSKHWARRFCLSSDVLQYVLTYSLRWSLPLRSVT